MFCQLPKRTPVKRWIILNHMSSSLTLCFDVIHSWAGSFDGDLTWTRTTACGVYCPQPEPRRAEEKDCLKKSFTKAMIYINSIKGKWNLQVHFPFSTAYRSKKQPKQRTFRWGKFNRTKHRLTECISPPSVQIINCIYVQHQRPFQS